MLKFVFFCFFLSTIVNGQQQPADLNTVLNSLYGPNGRPSTGQQRPPQNVQNVQPQRQVTNNGQQAQRGPQTPGVPPGTYMWGAWGAFGSCSVTCGQGQRRHQRVCYYYGTPQSSSSSGGALGGGLGNSLLPLMLASGGGDGGGGGGLGGLGGGGLGSMLTLSMLTGNGMFGGTNGQSSSGGATSQPTRRIPGNCVGFNIEILPCTAQRACTGVPVIPPPQNCYTAWGNFGQCSAPCGEAIRIRGRRCTCTNQATGRPTCSEPLTQTEPCTNLPPCVTTPVTTTTTTTTTSTVALGRWGNWGEWNGCSVECGVSSTAFRFRPCLGSATCSGPYTEQRDCVLIPCTTQATLTWSDWGEYGVCSATCGPGEKMRVRTCPVPGQCPGNYFEATDCRNSPCVTAPPPPVWGEWGEYGACSTTCGPGEKSRFRVCPLLGRCPGDVMERLDCGNFACTTAPQPPVWSQWGEYGACSTTCGPGEKSRFRLCPILGRCPGDFLEMLDCGNFACVTAPPAPQWREWGPYSDCSSTCGPGSKIRFRRCSEQGGCKGEDFESMSCNENVPCASWGQWGAYSSCTRTCGSGTKTRFRICRAQGKCEGDDLDSVPCGEDPCPTESPVTSQPLGKWGEFRAWGACGLNFDGNGCSQMRSRTCHGAINCDGNYIEFRSCFTGPCAAVITTPSRPPTTLNPNQNACDLSRPKNRRDCGHPGISREECWSRGCCYSDTVLGVNWCFIDDFSATQRTIKEEASAANGGPKDSKGQEAQSPQGMTDTDKQDF